MNKIAIVVLLAGLSGCVVPLKKPPTDGVSTGIPRIDFAEIAQFARAANDVYEDASVIEKDYGKYNVVIRELKENEGRYFIITRPDLMVQFISVRGTANKQNAIVDIDSIKFLDSRLGIYIHNGFSRAAQELYADVLPFLKKDYKIQITGHSLGGAMAALLMMKLDREGYKIDQVITFGQPKVTNEKGGKKFETLPYLRVVNDQDIVPQVPPSNILYDLSGVYEHFGPEVVIQLEGKWGYAPAHIPRDIITDDRWKHLNLANVIDHQMKNYLTRIDLLK